MDKRVVFDPVRGEYVDPETGEVLEDQVINVGDASTPRVYSYEDALKKYHTDVIKPQFHDWGVGTEIIISISDKAMFYATRYLHEVIHRLIKDPPNEVLVESVNLLRKIYSKKKKISRRMIYAIIYFLLVYKHRLLDARSITRKLASMTSVRSVRKTLFELMELGVIDLSSVLSRLADDKRKEVVKHIYMYENDQEVVQEAISLLRSVSTKKIIHKKSSILAIALIYLARKRLGKEVTKTSLIRKIATSDKEEDLINNTMHYYVRDILGTRSTKGKSFRADRND